MEKEILGSLYFGTSEKFGMGYMPQISKTIKAEKDDLGVVEMEVKQIGDSDKENFKNPKCGRVYNSSSFSDNQPCQGGQREHPIIVAMRGRNPDNPSERTAGSPTEQRLETNSQGICNTLTSVQKDNLVMEYQYKIRKLTPLECWHLMGFLDEDFYKAEAINSNSQLYKQAGNSIVKNVLMAILGQMIPGKEDIYKEL